ncbi:MAG: hypothetical protein HYR64_06025 [Fimbriimonas ginsengisoli]|uniref:Uncharacterized protein n=1 Tax=Fimbriimonas ginsengisoli TaxID=1005039 RepID=A0A931LUZ3_FIMGI|nr:hypothetical protein [Fimbriimonas ginsengisoli]
MELQVFPLCTQEAKLAQLAKMALKQGEPLGGSSSPRFFQCKPIDFLEPGLPLTHELRIHTSL